MSSYWPFIVLGVFAGAIYALAAMGVVLTYKTAGVFNFAYGAIAMFCAFTYWKLHDAWHITAWISMPLLLVVVAPAIALVFERLFRPLTGLSAEVQIVVSLGMLGLLEAAAPLLFGGQEQSLQPIFAHGTFLLGDGLHISWGQLGTLLVSLVLGGALWWLLRHTRFGTAARAVVDNAELAGMIGLSADHVRRIAWVISTVFAALVGILLSPTQGLDVYILTVVVIYTFAPAVLGRLVSLPWAYAGGIGLGVLVSVLSKWGASGTMADLEAALPYLALFVLLVALAPKLREAGVAVRRLAPSVGPAPSLRRSLVIGAVVFAGLAGAPLVLHGPRLGAVTGSLVYAMVALTLVVLMGWGGQISLAQFTFAGIGAFAVGHLAGAGGQHFWWAVLVGMAIAVPLGLVVGFASLRLSGLYLALATMAFALLMDNLVFNRGDVSGGYTGMTDSRPRLGSLNFASPVAFHELVVGVLAVMALVTVALWHSPIGRRLQILRDSPLAASTLGVNLTVTKLVTFAACGAVAALGGAFYGASQQSITPDDFAFSASLELLLLVVLSGRARIVGALIAGATFGIETLNLIPIPTGLVPYIPLAVAIGVVLLGQQPEGTVAVAVAETRRVLAVLRRLPAPAKPAPLVPAGAQHVPSRSVAAAPRAGLGTPGTVTPATQEVAGATPRPTPATREVAGAH